MRVLMINGSPHEHGNSHRVLEEVAGQLHAEGMQIMRTLGCNMAFLMKCINAGKEAGVEIPEREKSMWTNFVRS